MHLKEQFAENTARRLVGRAKQFFKRAVQLRIITSNPFDHLKSSVIAVKERQFFISRENVQKVLDACPNSQWRLLFALSRFGGLRCPSEHLLLKWSDVDWSAGKIRITSPKTEHHIGKGERWIPLFPELRSHLETAFEEADEGAEFVIHRYRNSNANLRTQLLRIIQRAGISPWPKLFQNLRSTRETELAEQYPLHVVTAWLGNSQPIALKHYLQVTDAHFQRAAGQSAEAAQNPAQYLPASGRMTLQPQQKNPQFSEENEGMRDCTTYKVPKRGVEPPRVLPH
ncbi:MAG: tyrosine-type recombinase/integrase [Planctomycetaceae bacterium]|nr:tyrosine-type recombinase/integrase [Planctomycetaceae bacterium]